MTVFSGAVRFRAAELGGRTSGPPIGRRYVATAVRALDGGEQQPSNWPWSGGQFSVVIEMESSRVTATEWTPATIFALVPDSPGSEVLNPGAEIVILEGPREVARFLIDRERPGGPVRES